MVVSLSVARPITVVAAAHGLEYTSASLAGQYGPIRSWAHIDTLVEREIGHPRGWLVVRRRDDPAHRFAQLVTSSREAAIDVGALDAGTGRHTVWRLRPAGGQSAPTTAGFAAIARDWLSMGVVPGWSATITPLDGDDEPF